MTSPGGTIAATPIAQFVRDGFLTVQTGLPSAFHPDLRQRAGVILDREGNCGNNILPRLPDLQRVFDNAVGNSVVCEFDIVGSLGRIRIGNTLFPELYTLDPDCAMALTKRGFPASGVAKSPMTTAVEELVRALETGEPPASDLTDARSDLELTVAFHLADRTRRVVSLPIADLDYSITDLWGRYA